MLFTTHKARRHVFSDVITLAPLSTPATGSPHLTKSGHQGAVWQLQVSQRYQ